MSSENSANYLVPYDERLANRAKKIRCRRCGRSSHEGLTICPNCGRSLRAAVSRWITWGIPLALAALLYLSIWGISGRSPIAMAMELPGRVAGMITDLGTLIEPRVMEPEVVLNQQAAAEQNAALNRAGDSNAGSSNALNGVTVVTPIAGDASAMEQPITDEPENQAPADPPAEQNVVAVLDDNSQNEGRSLTSPEAVSTSTPVPLPKATAAPVTPTSVPPTALPTVAPTVTDAPAATATPKPLAVTPTNNYRSDPLVLRAPAAGTALDCAGENVLSWQVPVSVVATDQYVLNLGYVSGQNESQYIVTWIAKQKFSVEKTSWRLDSAYCKLSPNEFNDQWIWYMQVVDGDDKIISVPSSTSYFIWRKSS